ncbi:hypothetical protein E4U09_004608 [Claviceps aff. purpurea]|uniref:Uncharacterized protein n=1 Tax=Claviceps aff. purpurea TaxID=1967640 RepID=A0A9P7QES6_9HYPO|nr:hypothetical protein E4U09_004608 [Claviceps aff. purpurea]
MATSRMASSVMYDDAQMATERPCPNFKDIVFWVQDKVPSRQFIIGLIQDNGGVISPLAEGAKVRIEVVQNLLRLPKQRRARRHTCSKAPPSTSSFTHDEDVALARYVRPHAARRRAGIPLYQAFAKSVSLPRFPCLPPIFEVDCLLLFAATCGMFCNALLMLPEYVTFMARVEEKMG